MIAMLLELGWDSVVVTYRVDSCELTLLRDRWKDPKYNGMLLPHGVGATLEEAYLNILQEKER